MTLEKRFKIYMLGVVVLNYNDSDTTMAFVESIKDYRIIDKIVVVDNASTDASFAELLTLTNAKIDVIKTDKNGGYGYGNNWGIRYACEKYKLNQVIISNPDIEVSEGTIKQCLRVLQTYKNTAVVAPVMLNCDGSVNFKCVWKI